VIDGWCYEAAETTDTSLKALTNAVQRVALLLLARCCWREKTSMVVDAIRRAQWLLVSGVSAVPAVSAAHHGILGIKRRWPVAADTPD
jgi:hypothetical protein